MKFLHLSDLHLGIRLYEQSLLEDQKQMLVAAVEIIKSENIDCVFIAGDIYDKQIPPAEAIILFDSFITALSTLDIPVFISSGNHDSTERLSFGNSIMSAKGIYVTPVYNGTISPVSISDEFGEIDVYMIPFIKPANVRRFFEETEINTYTDAMRAVISALPIDRSKRNVLVCHQNVGTEEMCDFSIGGLDMVDASVFEPFDYVALGHIHEEHPVLREEIRYCGTVLCYDFKFFESQRGFVVVNMNNEGKVEVDTTPYLPIHPMMKLRGELADLVSPDKIDNRFKECYLHVTLTDEQEIIDSVGKLRAVYPYVLSVEYDNTRTRTEQYVQLGGDTTQKSPFELFSEFYEIQNNAPLNEEQTSIVKDIIEEIWGEIE